MITLCAESCPVLALKKDSRTYVTYGSEEFFYQFDRLGGRRQDLPSNWGSIINQSWEDQLYNPIKKLLIFESNDISVSNGTQSLYNSLYLTFDLTAKQPFEIHNKFSDIFPSLFISLSKAHEFPKCNFQFTARQGYASNISKGIQPIRWTDYYRGLEDKEVGDSFEGIESIKVAKSDNKKDSIINSTVKQIGLNSIIISLHEKGIDQKNKESFGEDTYEINDFCLWVSSTALAIDRYMKYSYQNEQAKGLKYIGLFSYFGKCVYSDEKIQVDGTKNVTLSESLNHVNTLFVRTTFYENPGPFDDIYLNIDKSLMMKPEKYSGQLEWRLCFLPIVANNEAAGFAPTSIVEAMTNQVQGHRLLKP